MPSIDYDFYDINLFYKQYTNININIGVIKMLMELNIEGENNVHDAETDAFNTMLEMKAILSRLELSLQDLIFLCSNVKDKSENYIISSIHAKRLREENEIKLSLS